jgi:hypothetical protein
MVNCELMKIKYVLLECFDRLVDVNPEDPSLLRLTLELMATCGTKE